MRLYSFVAAAALLSASLVAHADVIYSFVGSQDSYPGTTFTIDSPDFLTYSSTPVPVTAGSHLIEAQGPHPDEVTDYGQITAVGFFSDNTVVYSGAAIVTGFSDPFPLSPDGIFDITLGEHVVGTLTISGSPAVTPVAATPEPSSLALLGTGLLGVVGVMRKRFA